MRHDLHINNFFSRRLTFPRKIAGLVLNVFSHSGQEFSHNSPVKIVIWTQENKLQEREVSAAVRGGGCGGQKMEDSTGLVSINCKFSLFFLLPRTMKLAIIKLRKS